MEGFILFGIGALLCGFSCFLCLGVGAATDQGDRDKVVYGLWFAGVLFLMGITAMGFA